MLANEAVTKLSNYITHLQTWDLLQAILKAGLQVFIASQEIVGTFAGSKLLAVLVI